ncbi:hypothetical protein BDV12DRAFT_178972 [Aspergillus spectabilis]
MPLNAYLVVPLTGTAVICNERITSSISETSASTPFDIFPYVSSTMTILLMLNACGMLLLQI